MNHSLPRFLSPTCVLLAGLASCLTSLSVSAAVPSEAAGKAAVIGQPTELVVQPASIALRGGHAHQQIVVTGRYANNVVRDLTGLCELSSETPAVAGVDATGFVTPKTNGTTALVVKAGGKSVRVAVAVTDLDKPHVTSF